MRRSGFGQNFATVATYAARSAAGSFDRRSTQVSISARGAPISQNHQLPDSPRAGL